MGKYNHTKIEETWKDKWFEDNIYEAVDFDKRPKQYILAELPYPSGKYLHVGHMMRYTVPEIYSRFLRMRGYNVLFPMGWDCFGLPAETFAIKEGITPQEAIAGAMIDYKKAMQNMGYGIDWAREINTSDPKYYKWTQWTFIKLWEQGLAELKEMPVWWCKELGVLADEEVLPDTKSPTGKKSERGGYPVERKMFKQWVLKITEFADRLLADLDTVDYLDSVKHGQVNWIGRKFGAHIKWNIAGEVVQTFTTRPDTIFGVTYLVLAPEHALVQKLLTKISNKDDVLAYIEKVKGFSDLERQTKEKTGIQLKGIFAKHPFSEVTREIPVYIADYVLLDFGTGVVQGVPAHDERDFEFAQNLGIEVIEVIKKPETITTEYYTGEGEIINSGTYNGLSSEEFRNEVISRLEKEGNGKAAKTYKLRDQIFSRQRYWGEPIPLVYKEDGTIEKVAEDKLPLELPIMKDFLPADDGTSPLAKNTEWNKTVDSEGSPATRETDTMPTWAGSNWYYMRYIDPHCDTSPADFEKLKYWMPVDKYFGDAGHTTAHLMYSRFWYKFLYDNGIVPTSEPYKWRMSGGLLLGADHRKMSKSRPDFVVDPADVLTNYGADATRVYLAFIGPYDETYPWNDNGIKACYRLIKTIYEMKTKVKDENVNDIHTIKAVHKLIKNTSKMMENLKMNTAVSEIMIFVNHLKTVDSIDTNVWKDFVKVLAPFAPFTAEDLWQEVNGYSEWKKENSVHLQNFPEFDEKLAKADTIELPIQINGKVRERITVEADTKEEEIKKIVLETPKVKTLLGGSTITKFIYIPNKIVNIVY